MKANKTEHISVIKLTGFLKNATILIKTCISQNNTTAIITENIDAHKTAPAAESFACFILSLYSGVQQHSNAVLTISSDNTSEMTINKITHVILSKL